MTLVADPLAPTLVPIEPVASPGMTEGVRLAQWIREGCRGTRQTRGRLFVGQEASCALGALYQGLLGHTHPERDWIDEMSEAAQINFMRPVLVPWTGCMMPLYLLIIFLNDELRWSREKIADWLEVHV